MSPDPTSAERARLAARAAWSKSGTDTVVLGVGEVLAIVDWFVVTSASNPRQARTIAEEVEDQLRRRDGSGPIRVEGADDARWILLDFGDVAVHVMLEEARAYYELERLWGDVARLEWDTGEAPVGESPEAAARPR
ncbi:MAG: ribosome silencing factor [Acidimicrobiales bacterium]